MLLDYDDPLLEGLEGLERKRSANRKYRISSEVFLVRERLN